MQFPGDLTPEEREAAFLSLRDASLVKWGEPRTAALEATLRDAAVAIARLGRLKFGRDDAPAFYLHETLPERRDA